MRPDSPRDFGAIQIIYLLTYLLTLLLSLLDLQLISTLCRTITLTYSHTSARFYQASARAASSICSLSRLLFHVPEQTTATVASRLFKDLGSGRLEVFLLNCEHRTNKLKTLFSMRSCRVSTQRICSTVRSWLYIYKNLAIANRSRVSCINTNNNNNTMTLKSGLEVTQGH